MKKLLLLLVCAASLFGSNAVLGTAVFSAATGSITGLTMAGDITAVTRLSTGQFSVSLSGSPTNYLAMLSVGDTTAAIAAQVDPVSSYGPGGFSFAVIANSAIVYDPGVMFVVIMGSTNTTPPASIIGTAVFSASSGSISLLTITGDVSGVTRTGAGQYAIAFAGTHTAYLPLLSVGDTLQPATLQVDPVSSYTPTGFTIQAIASSSTAYDPAMVMVVVVGN